MKIISKSNELELSGSNVIIRKRGVANMMASGLNGDRTIAISTITSIQLKKAGWVPGYILFSYAGSKPFSGGIIEATQDPDSLMFDKTLNEEVEEFKNKVEEIMRTSKSPSIGNPASSLTDEIMKLATMKENGILSEEEFNAAKKKLLG
jgi:hypothetical protein